MTAKRDCDTATTYRPTDDRLMIRGSHLKALRLLTWCCVILLAVLFLLPAQDVVSHQLSWPIRAFHCLCRVVRDRDGWQRPGPRRCRNPGSMPDEMLDALGPLGPEGSRRFSGEPTERTPTTPPRGNPGFLPGQGHGNLSLGGSLATAKAKSGGERRNGYLRVRFC
jgi:hypothetical protein